jgi:hypothetical protein
MAVTLPLWITAPIAFGALYGLVYLAMFWTKAPGPMSRFETLLPENVTPGDSVSAGYSEGSSTIPRLLIQAAQLLRF